MRLPVHVLAWLLGAAGSVQAAGENPRFAAVERQLDRDGDFYLYLNVRPFLEFAQGLIDSGLKIAAEAMKGQDEAKRGQFDLVVSTARQVARELGLDQLGDVGLSTRAMGDGLFRTRLVLSRNRPDDAGLFWRSLPDNGVGLPAAALLPRDAVLAFSKRMEVAKFWTGLKALVAGTPAKPLLEQGLSQAKASGVDVEAIIASIGDEFTISLSLDETRTLELPGLGVIPEPSFLIALKIRDRTLPTLANLAAAGLKEVSSTTNLAEGVSALVVTPPGVPPAFRPAWVDHQNWLMAASHPQALQRVLRRLAGEEEPLTTHPEFRRYAQGLPENGISVFFLSKRFAETYTGVLKNVLGSMPGPQEEILVPALEALFGRMNELSGLLSVVEKLPDGGVRSTTQGPFNNAISVGYTAFVLPVAVAAAMILPAVVVSRQEVQTFPMPDHEVEGEPAPALEAAPEAEPATAPPSVEPAGTTAAPAPNPAAEKKACSANLQAIHKAIQRRRFGTSSGPLFPAGEFPVCPSGGEYILPTSDLELPRCTHAGHTFR
jgi:hypothetical protein